MRRYRDVKIDSEINEDIVDQIIEAEQIGEEIQNTEEIVTIEEQFIYNSSAIG